MFIGFFSSATDISDMCGRAWRRAALIIAARFAGRTPDYRSVLRSGCDLLSSHRSQLLRAAETSQLVL